MTLECRDIRIVPKRYEFPSTLRFAQVAVRLLCRLELKKTAVGFAAVFELGIFVELCVVLLDGFSEIIGESDICVVQLVVVEEEHYDLIVCNTPVGGVLTRLAARQCRKEGTRVVYIAHGFHFYKGASKKNWLLFYPLEKTLARLCDVVVTINEEDYSLAKKQFPGRVEHIHGIGVREDRYHPATAEEQAEMRRAEGLRKDDFVVLCTGELNENKNQKTLISAAALLKSKIPNLKVLLAGNGPKEQELREQIAAEGLEDVVKLLGYRTDLERLVPAVDVVASCSKREGLPLNIVEAMLCKKPVVASVNRGNAELVDDGVTGYLVKPEDAASFAERILFLEQNHPHAVYMGESAYVKAKAYSVLQVSKELAGILIA